MDWPIIGVEMLGLESGQVNESQQARAQVYSLVHGVRRTSKAGFLDEANSMVWSIRADSYGRRLSPLFRGYSTQVLEGRRRVSIHCRGCEVLKGETGESTG